LIQNQKVTDLNHLSYGGLEGRIVASEIGVNNSIISVFGGKNKNIWCSHFDDKKLAAKLWLSSAGRPFYI
jgi:hypothetical protein